MWPQTEEGRTHRNEGVEQEAGEQGPPPPLAVRGAAPAHTPTIPITPRCTQLVSPLLPAQRGQLLRVPARGRRHLRARRQPQRAQRPQRRVVTRRTDTVPVSPSEEHRRLHSRRATRHIYIMKGRRVACLAVTVLLSCAVSMARAVRSLDLSTG